MNSFEFPGVTRDKGFDGNFLTDRVASGPPLGPPLFLMAQPAQILPLSELDKLTQVKCIAYLKGKPANLDELLLEMLKKSDEYSDIITKLGIKFWCVWCKRALDDDKTKRITLLNAHLPEKLKIKKAFQSLFLGIKRASDAQATTMKRAKMTVVEPNVAVAAPDHFFAVLHSEPAHDDSRFDFNLDAFIELSDMDWDLLNAISIDDDSLGAPVLDKPQDESNVAQAKRGSVKRSNTGGADSTFRKKRILATDAVTENIPKEDIELFREHTDIKPGIVNFLFRFEKKYESFKNLFQLNDMLTTPYKILKSSGFVFLQMINILHPFGGDKNLEALQALTVKAADQDQTPLQQLKDAGFEPTDIVSILVNSGGYNNLNALQALIVKAADQDQTPLQKLKNAGFEPTNIVSVLANNGGYNNLNALQALIVKAADQDQTPLQQLKDAGFEPTNIVSILANSGGYNNLKALLNFIPGYVGLTAPEKTAFLSFVSKTGASTRVELAQRLIKLHTDKIDKASLFDFLKNATNKSTVKLEALPLEQLVKHIKTKEAKRVPARRQQKPSAVAPSSYNFVQGAFGGLAGVPGYNPDDIPKVPDGGQEVVAAQTAEV